MIKSKMWNEEISKDRGGAFLLTTALIPLFMIVMALVAGILLERLDTSAAALFIGALLLLVVLALGHYELAVTMVVMVHIYIDWFSGWEIFGTSVAVGLLFLLFVIRSAHYQWLTPRALWLWVLFLVITIPSALQGSHGNYELAFYYPNTIFGALVMFWLGLLVSQNKTHLRILFHELALLGTLLAIHTIIQTKTGIFVFTTSSYDAYLTRVSDFILTSSNVSRSGSFFLNPDWNGTFFAIMLFLPLGLFAEATSLPLKFLYFIELLLMSIALLFTYSIGAMIGTSVGIIAFIFFVGRSYYRLLIPLLLILVAGMFAIIFPSELNLLLRHATNPAEVSLRSGAWQTAINITKAFPLTGIGLSLTNYLYRAEPYRDPAQYRPLAHPHNSYLEWSAMAGLPVLIVFLALLVFALWQAWRNWKKVDVRTRSLFGGGIASVIALSVNSWSINGWTLPPLAAIGWLILGAMASPLVRKTHIKQKAPSHNEIRM